MVGDESAAGAGSAAGSAGSGLGIMPIIVVAIVVVAAVGGIFIMNKMGEPDLEPNEISATLIIDYGNGTVETYNVTTVNNSVPGLLDEAIGAENYDMGRQTNGVKFLMNIDGYGEIQQVAAAANAGISVGDLHSWQYYLDGKRGPNTTAAFEFREEFALVDDGQTVKLVWENHPHPTGIFTDTGVSVEVIIDYGNGTVVSQNVTTQNFTALGTLEAAVGHENLDIQDFGYGDFVNGINGVTTGATVDGIDDTSDYYWMWYINGEMASVGADQYACVEGDIVKFAFEESSW